MSRRLKWTRQSKFILYHAQSDARYPDRLKWTARTRNQGIGVITAGYIPLNADSREGRRSSGECGAIAPGTAKSSSNMTTRDGCVPQFSSCPSANH